MSPPTVFVDLEGGNVWDWFLAASRLQLFVIQQASSERVDKRSVL